MAVVELEVLIPAVITAFSTTLVVEYFAKPWLEVRKDRILDHHQGRRELQQALAMLGQHVGTLSRVETLPPAALPRVLEEIEQFRGRLTVIQRRLLVLHNWGVPGEVVAAIASGVGRLEGALLSLSAALSGSSGPDEIPGAIAAVQEAHEALIPAADYVILKGRTFRQGFVSKKRTMRAALKAIRSGRVADYPPLRDGSAP